MDNGVRPRFTDYVTERAVSITLYISIYVIRTRQNGVLTLSRALVAIILSCFKASGEIRLDPIIRYVTVSVDKAPRRDPAVRGLVVDSGIDWGCSDLKVGRAGFAKYMDYRPACHRGFCK